MPTFPKASRLSGNPAQIRTLLVRHRFWIYAVLLVLALALILAEQLSYR